MNEDLHGIDKLFQQGLEGHAEAPPPHMWEQLDKKLDQKKAAAIAGRYNRLKWVAAVLFLISVGMGMWVVQLHTTHSGNLAGEEPGRHTGVLAPKQGTASNLRTGSPADKKNAPQNQANQQVSSPTNQPFLPAPLPGREARQLAKGPDAATPSGSVIKRQPNKADQLTHQEMYTPASVSTVKHIPAVETTRTARLQHEARNEQGAMIGGSGEVVQRRIREEAVRQNINEFSAQDGADVLLRAAIISDQTALANKILIDPAGMLPLVLASELRGPVSAPNPVRITPLHAPSFTATVFFSPNLVSSFVTNNSRIPHGREDDKNVIKAKEQNGSSRSAGVLIGYNFNPRWSVSSGLVLTNRTTEIETKMIYARPDPRGGGVKYRFNCSSGYSYINLKSGGGSPFNGDSAKAVSSTSKLQYVSVPVMVKYNFGQGKLRFMTGAGLQASFLTMRKIETYITKGTNQDFANTSDIHGLRPVYFSGLVSAGASYKLSRILTASLVPSAQLGFTSINQQSPVKSYINFYGLSFGLSVQL